MDNVFLPTDEIYIEINGQKIGNIEKYKEKIVRENLVIESVWEYEPVKNLCGKVRYDIELYKIYIYTLLIGGGKNINKLSSFELAVGTSKGKVTYSGCEWVEMSRSVDVAMNTYDVIKISATKRREIIF